MDSILIASADKVLTRNYSPSIMPCHKVFAQLPKVIADLVNVTWYTWAISSTNSVLISQPSHNTSRSEFFIQKFLRFITNSITEQTPTCDSCQNSKFTTKLIFSQPSIETIWSRFFEAAFPLFRQFQERLSDEKLFYFLYFDLDRAEGEGNRIRRRLQWTV